MKVIFLDIDGVLNVMHPDRDEYGRCFHPHFEDNLKRIIKETGAKIVISSTWRASGLMVMQEMWIKRQLAGEVIDITCHLKSRRRGQEIQVWLDSNEVESYVILDDDTDMELHQMKCFVRTSENQHHRDCVDVGYGLTDICTDQAIGILNGIN
jgi:hypothetical protein